MATIFSTTFEPTGRKSPEYKQWGKTLRTTFKDKTFPESDDQSALSYLLLKGEQKWREQNSRTTDYSLHGYWLGIVSRFDKITENYTKIERDVPMLRRRHAEAVSESYAAAWEPLAAEGGDGRSGWRQPFITSRGVSRAIGDHAAGMWVIRVGWEWNER
ncbi:alpha-1,6-mannosyltransferase [Datura stramonium]|uniref:Alpha-1,6-mannosyltransferase n=1 Tax=Datura stramonium TaxID=4076 RepID=A0ABS8THS1_DATST|nr:alpha-1,6-mannosyltransferase [Datura stramonium]